jgi:hypothetical protein
MVTLDCKPNPNGVATYVGVPLVETTVREPEVVKSPLREK